MKQIYFLWSKHFTLQESKKKDKLHYQYLIQLLCTKIIYTHICDSITAFYKLLILCKM